MRSLTDLESRAAAQLRALVGDCALLQPTATALSKSIIDAIAPFRAYLADNGVHDYRSQAKGPAAKRLVAAQYLTPYGLVPTQASLYRPETKDGDPRLWFGQLPQYANADDILAVFVFSDQLQIVNLSNSDLHHVDFDSQESRSRPDVEFLNEIRNVRNAASGRLLHSLRKHAGNWIPAQGHGDTAVGRTVESLIGVAINSSRSPDFDGVEVKAKRYRAGRSKTRRTLFAKTPLWPECRYRSSGELLRAFGYQRENIERLYCQINHGRLNSQGLRLRVDPFGDLLYVQAGMPEEHDAVVWYFDTLRDALREKHNETFWVDVATREGPTGNEEFRLVGVTHTRKPYATRLPELITRDLVTVDFLIKELESGGVKDKGYLFKLHHDGLGELFPTPETYSFAV
jgi:hypothetical protein